MISYARSQTFKTCAALPIADDAVYICACAYCVFNILPGACGKRVYRNAIYGFCFQRGCVNNCAGGNCLTNCTTCTNCADCPDCPQCDDEEPVKNAFELEKGSLYSVRLDMGNVRNLVVKSSDTKVATASLRSYRNGTAVILVRALNPGDAIITVCPANNPAACETVYINVAGAKTQLGSTSSESSGLCSAYAEEVLKYVNEARVKNNLSALQLDAALCNAAEVRAKEVTTRFSHTRPDGTSCFTVLRDFGIGYRICGENIAKGFRDAQSVVNAWMNSSGHRANILNPNYTHMGVGKSGTGWGQLFVG